MAENEEPGEKGNYYGRPPWLDAVGWIKIAMGANKRWQERSADLIELLEAGRLPEIEYRRLYLNEPDEESDEKIVLLIETPGGEMGKRP